MLVHDPHSFADTRQGRIRHIDFELDVDFDSKQLRGTGHYTLEAPVAGSLFLDVRGIGIERVCAGESDLAWSFDQEDRVKGQRLHILNPQGLSRVTIQFVTSPGAIALGWLAPELTAGGKHPFLLSQCQAIHARSMIPCQDTPSVRFTYSATVRVPAPLTAAMSAGHTGVHQQGDVNVCTFEMPQAIPSYLFALAVGNLAFQKLGSCCGVFAEPEVLQQAAWEFAETEKLIHEAEKLFGPYLWETFNMLILPPSFPYGGMENPRLTFLTPTLITGDRSMVHVVAHELAHSWTGNLVTNATWEDFWLNEGWTVYAERRILEVLEGPAYAQLHAAVRRGNMLEDMRLFGMDADATKLKFSQEGIAPDDVFSTVPYEKGCSLLSLIDERFGRERFDRLTRKYIETFKFQSLTTDDFLTFLRQELPGLDEVIDLHKWVFEAGFPEDALVPRSPLVDDVDARLQAYAAGRRPRSDEVSGWKAQQVEVFLKRLPRVIPTEDCAYFEDLFKLKSTRNRNIQTEYFVVAIRSGHEPVLAGVDQLLAAVGRMLFLKPLYRALVETTWSRAHAHELFARHRGAYHPIAVRGLELILAAHVA